jgi:quinol monooxygenase YgiN
MSFPGNTVSLHPYFKIKPGKLDIVRSLLPAFVSRTQKEPKCLCYDFTLQGDILFCREAYVGAEGVIEHLDNVGSLLEEMLKHADIERLELHGPSGELDKLRERCGPLNPKWFVLQCGIKG